MKKLLTALFSALLFCCTAAPEQMKASLPEMKRRPVMDGTLSAGEWKDGIQVYGLVRHNSPYLSSRQGTLYFGMEGVFLLCRKDGTAPGRRAAPEQSEETGRGGLSG